MIRARLPLLASMMLALAGCPSGKAEPPPAGVKSAASSPAPPPASGSAAPGASTSTMTIQKNTQATIDDVKLGVGNIWEEEYTDEKGAKKNGLTSGLWVYIRDDASKNTTLRVHPGQTLTASKLKITVDSVTNDAIVIRIVK